MAPPRLLMTGLPASTATAPPPFDVVIVPDFMGSQAQVQEGQAILFLSSWLQQYGNESRLPLHLACIGEPPATVRRLAARAGARISLHAPIGIQDGHHVGNKLRGLEVPAETSQRLLLDVDTLILNDISPLGHWTSCLAAAPDDCPKVTNAQWKRIYQGLQLDPPHNLSRCLADELGLPNFPGRWLGYKVPRWERNDLLPYYNGGAVLAPVDCDLRVLWEQNIRRIAALFPQHEGKLKSIHTSDQAGLAVSLWQLSQQGWCLRRLPDSLNCRWRNIYAESPSLHETGVLHLTTFLCDLPKGPVTDDRLQKAVSSYLGRKLARRFSRLLVGEALRGTLMAGMFRFGQARRQCRELEHHLHKLLNQHVWDCDDTPISQYSKDRQVLGSPQRKDQKSSGAAA
ncbi:MAG: hypothetical protein MK161_04460 [Pirellulales bacterium]|nr:hypothetical protein [Pirellulales bacterium]